MNQNYDNVEYNNSENGNQDQTDMNVQNQSIRDFNNENQQPYTNYSNAVYDDGSVSGFEKKSRFPKVLLIILGVIIIIVIILLLKYCSSSLKEIVLSDVPVMYVDEEYKITASATGNGDLSNTVFKFEIGNQEIAEVENGTQTGIGVEEKIKAKLIGETTLKVTATGRTSSQTIIKQADVIVCDRLDVENIANNTITLNLNETKSLGITLGDNAKCKENLTVKFEDESVISIDDNFQITGLKVGTTTLVLSDGQNNVTYTITVVDPNAKVLATQLTLNKKSVTLVVGSQSRVYATIKPSDVTTTKITWSSNKTGVATVSGSGLIKAKAVGVAYITVATTDGSNKTATVKVTVVKPKPKPTKPAVIKVASLTFASGSYSIKVGETATAGVNISPANASNKTISCTSSNTAVATVTVSGNACVIKGVSTGTATITAKANGGNNKTATTTVTIVNPSSGGSSGGSSGSSKCDKYKISSSCSGWTCPSGCKSGKYKISAGPNKGKYECFCR